MNIRLYSIHVGLLLALATTMAGQSSGQPPFYARDFMRTLVLEQGRDVWIESPGMPVAVVSGTTYLAGAFPTSDFAFASLLRKYDPAGNEQWTRQISAGGPTLASAIAADNNAVYLAGAIGIGHTDMFVRKYDASGNELWSRLIHVIDSYHGVAGIAVDASGVYVAGWSLDQALI